MGLDVFLNYGDRYLDLSRKATGTLPSKIQQMDFHTTEAYSEIRGTWRKDLGTAALDIHGLMGGLGSPRVFASRNCVLGFD